MTVVQSLRNLHWFDAEPEVNGNQVKGLTNVCYNCVDRHLSDKGKLDETALVWEGNYWDDEVHDYADITWETVGILVNKIGNLLSKYVSKGERFLLLSPNVIQLPLILLGANRIGAVPIVINAATIEENRLVEVLREGACSLLITVDGFWQGHTLFDTKSMLDRALSEVPIAHVIVIRHCGPNPGTPAPEYEFPARRPCYALKVNYVEGRDEEWSKLISKCDQICAAAQLPADHPFLTIPHWTNGQLNLATISSIKVLTAATQVIDKVPLGTLSFVFGNKHGGHAVIAGLAVLLAGKGLLIFEGIVDHPDPSRIAHIINKYEADTLLLENIESLDKEYLSLVPVPTLKTVQVPPDDVQRAKDIFPNATITPLDTSALLA